MALVAIPCVALVLAANILAGALNTTYKYDGPYFLNLQTDIQKSRQTKAAADIFVHGTPTVPTGQSTPTPAPDLVDMVLASSPDDLDTDTVRNMIAEGWEPYVVQIVGGPQSLVQEVYLRRKA